MHGHVSFAGFQGSGFVSCVSMLLSHNMSEDHDETLDKHASRHLPSTKDALTPAGINVGSQAEDTPHRTCCPAAEHQRDAGLKLLLLAALHLQCISPPT